MKKITVRLYERPRPLLFNEGGLAQAAEAVRSSGRGGDEVLVHVNPHEFDQMQKMWGEPSRNPHTGLPEYGFFSSLWNTIKTVLVGDKSTSSPGILSRIYSSIKSDPLKAIQVAGVLGSLFSKQKENQPIPLPASMTGKLPVVNFNRTNLSHQPSFQPPNYYTYGAAPEQQFFSQDQVPALPEEESPVLGVGNVVTQPLNQPLIEAAQGRLVRGPGTGRSDDIPARLSDGEYVIDAETVSLLGDGSTDAGAARLDEMRQRLRKHKGKNLMQGKFSSAAKHPEQYLAEGGKVGTIKKVFSEGQRVRVKNPPSRMDSVGTIVGTNPGNSDHEWIHFDKSRKTIMYPHSDLYRIEVPVDEKAEGGKVGALGKATIMSNPKEAARRRLVKEFKFWQDLANTAEENGSSEDSAKLFEAAHRAKARLERMGVDMDKHMARGGKVAKVMNEFKRGVLHSSSKKGPLVKNSKQAIAIALSEQRRMKMAKGGKVGALGHVKRLNKVRL